MQRNRFIISYLSFDYFDYTFDSNYEIIILIKQFYFTFTYELLRLGKYHDTRVINYVNMQAMYHSSPPTQHIPMFH